MADDRVLSGQRKLSSHIDAAFGQNGWTRIADTKIYHAADGTDDGSNTYDGQEIGHYYAIKCITTATLFDASGCTGVGIDMDDTDALAVGDIIYGKWDTIQLLSGTVYAYRARSKG